MIQEGQRTVGRQGDQPDRQARELHGHGVQVDAEETALCHEPPEPGPIAIVDIVCCVDTIPDERSFVRRGEVATRAHEEGTAAHGRVDESKVEDALGPLVRDKGMERAPDEKIRERSRRVERAGGLTSRGSGNEPDPARLERARGRPTLRGTP